MRVVLVSLAMAGLLGACGRTSGPACRGVLVLETAEDASAWPVVAKGTPARVAERKSDFAMTAEIDYAVTLDRFELTYTTSLYKGQQISCGAVTVRDATCSYDRITPTPPVPWLCNGPLVLRRSAAGKYALAYSAPGARDEVALVAFRQAVPR